MSRNGLSCRAAPALGRSAAAAFAAFLSLPTAAWAADKLIEVQWTDPEIKSFVAANAQPRSLGPTADDQLAKLKLPVLAFEGTPGVAEKTFRLGPRPATERDVVMDEENPVWYQIVEHYGDVTVSVSADLRVQHEFSRDAVKAHVADNVKVVLGHALNGPAHKENVRVVLNVEEVAGSKVDIALFLASVDAGSFNLDAYRDRFPAQVIEVNVARETVEAPTHNVDHHVANSEPDLARVRVNSPPADCAHRVLHPLRLPGSAPVPTPPTVAPQSCHHSILCKA